MSMNAAEDVSEHSPDMGRNNLGVVNGACAVRRQAVLRLQAKWVNKPASVKASQPLQRTKRHACGRESYKTRQWGYARHTPTAGQQAGATT